ncbi:hypothetical protein CIHG_06446 [Coccidioides immitis H538.4]|uniref:Uncharacterized protein n=1 Tax=Coccidioides immitis H538.4 TaxID=396776 RepID=A0A0J8RVF7_COCIT|nr:hypothetical protein CIHG_06446 [Coccidioides immitis H538.4]
MKITKSDWGVIYPSVPERIGLGDELSPGFSTWSFRRPDRRYCLCNLNGSRYINVKVAMPRQRAVASGFGLSTIDESIVIYNHGGRRAGTGKGFVTRATSITDPEMHRWVGSRKEQHPSLRTKEEEE